MAISGNDVKKITPMSDDFIEDVLAVYNKMKDTKSINTKFSRRKPDNAELTHEQMASTQLGGENDLSFVYSINEQVVGFVWGRLAYVGMPVQLVGFIHMIIVDPDLQRKGIARELLDAVAVKCGERGVNTLRTVVGENDWELSTFFHEADFENSGLLIYTRTIK
ncbi:MAG: GNAT family N-acetyltransferase [Dehalococcoidales bacterium]|nr:GNAT family N-acetyltransferase [Dehalococcoidales bacterium]